MFNRIIAVAVLLALPLAAYAQEFKVNFGIAQSEPDAPIEVAADSLSIDQETGNAFFDGNVIIEQGSMRMEAAVVTVTYSEESSAIARLTGSGGVTIQSGADVATSETAEYNVDSGLIKMRGNVSLRQGRAQISAGTMDVNLNNSTAELHGRVRTVLQTGGD